MNEAPAPLYYLHNYQTLLRWVCERYDDILSDSELAFATQFLAASEPAQALLTRLITRKGDFFRVSKLVYQEIPLLAEAVGELKALNWLDANPSQFTVADVASQLTRVELTQWLGKFSGTKAQWIVSLEAQAGTDKHDWAKWFSGDFPGFPSAPVLACDLVALTITPMCDVFNLLFFGNHYQALNEFVLTELGIFHYEQVTLTAQCRSFHQRADVDFYLALQAARDLFDRQDDVALSFAAIPKPSDKVKIATPVWLARRKDKFIYQLAYRLEQKKQWQQALALYDVCGLETVRVRQVRVLERLGEYGAALSLLEQGLLSPQNEAEIQQLTRAQPRLQRALGQAATKAIKFSPRSNTYSLAASDERVELLAAEYYETDEAPVYWVENTLWLGLFGLLFWPAIFAPVSGAFFNPFQSRPKDLYHPGFAARRELWFKECWALLDTDAYKEQIMARFHQKQGLQSDFVQWTWLTEEILNLALVCIAPNQLRAIFTRLLFDLKENRTGFPDLIQFFPHEQRFQLIEVKGPGDKLQDNQLRWLEYFERENMSAHVCYVQWSA